jgi:hypothetical protein
MGYYANSTEVDFLIPADKVAEALAAVNEDFDTEYTSLTDAVEDLTCFQDCLEVTDEYVLGDGAGGFRLGYHIDKYLSCTDSLLGILARFAKEGSFVRFAGEEDDLFGFRVVGGQLREEQAEVTWTVQ